MNRSFQFSTFFITVLLVLALSAIATVPVLADGGTPPAGSATEGRTSNGGSSSNSLAQVPSGTKVVIVNSTGDKVSLGSQEAQDVLNSGDPVWCPAALSTPTPGTGGCTGPGVTSFNSLLTTLSGNQSVYAKNGTIWIEASYVSSSNDSGSTSFTLDGSGSTGYNFSILRNFTLTIQGGWIGTSGNKTITGLSEFDVPISIINWNNNVTVNDILVQNTTSDGLTIRTTKNIALKDVHSNGNSGDGAYLDNCLWNGTNCVGVGTVTVTSSYFDGDGNDGLDVYSKGAITLNNVTAGDTLGNNQYGAWLDNCNYGDPFDNTVGCLILTSSAVTLTGNNQFNYNGQDGLDVYTTGAITASNLTANDNGQIGARLDNCQSYEFDTADDYWTCSAASAHTATLTGFNTFNGNGYDGLDIYSNGVLTTNNLTAQDNWGDGAYLDNDWAMTPLALTIAGNNDFENNYYDGLDANSYGVLTANDITANGNGTSGVTTDEYTGGVGAYFWGYKGVTLTGASTFNGNYSIMTYDDGDPNDYWTWEAGGLTISSSGPIKVSNVSADGDQAGAGVWLDNCETDGSGNCYNNAQTVTVTNLNATNNAMDGLDAYSFGNITTTDLNASGNGGSGIYLENDYAGYFSGLNSKGTVTLTGTTIANDNYGDGLDVYSYGAIKAGNIHAINNSGDGAHLENKSALSAQAVTLTGNNNFSYNDGSGLKVYSNGAITLSTLNANFNEVNGADLENNNPGFTSAVTLSGNDSFNDNSSASGLYLLSKGVISVNTLSLVANGNGIDGAYLDNSGAATAKTVTLNGTSVFDGNYAQYFDGVNTYPGAGLNIVSKGSIKVNNVTADDNTDGAGALLDTTAGSASATVTLTGFGIFNNNAGDGLDVNSHGAVTLAKVTADGNQGASGSLYTGAGVYVSANGKVTLSCGNLSNNAEYGIAVDTSPLLTLLGPVFVDNGTQDIYTGLGVGLMQARTCSLP